MQCFFASTHVMPSAYLDSEAWPRVASDGPYRTEEEAEQSAKALVGYRQYWAVNAKEVENPDFDHPKTEFSNW